MKRRIKYKNLISLTLILILLVALCIPTSYALDNSKRRFGAWVLSAIQAINITASSTLAPAQSMIDAIADPPGMVGVYSYPWEPDWDDEILSRSSIQIWNDYVEIDGVKYTDIWLSHDAAEKFRVNAFDWKTAYRIASESQGTFASGEGYIAGVPVYDIDGVLQTQAYSIPTHGTYQLGNGTFQAINRSSTYNQTQYNLDGNTYFYKNNMYKNQSPFPWNVGFKKINTYWKEFLITPEFDYTTSLDGNLNSYWVYNPFDFDYVSGVIPADQILPQDTGLMIRVPSNTTGLQPFINDHPEYTQPGGVVMNFDIHPEIKVEIEDLMDILAPIIPVVNVGDIQFTTNHETPVPPVPDVPIIDATVPQVVNPIINEITNYGDQITQAIPQIIETIPTIDDICENIDTAPYHDLDTGLNHLPSFLLPFITDLRSALGIWHYVTEWLAQISTSFAFISGCLVGTTIMTPIYAGIAGFMCIKIYRRMTGS